MYDDRFSKRYGFWRPVTDEVVVKYLQCGDPHFGFARIRCEECGSEYLRAFSCKCRGFCPSCSKRKSLDLAIFLEEELFRERSRSYTTVLTVRHGGAVSTVRAFYRKYQAKKNPPLQ